jgi:hypothetical protein
VGNQGHFCHILPRDVGLVLVGGDGVGHVVVATALGVAAVARVGPGGVGGKQLLAFLVDVLAILLCRLSWSFFVGKWARCSRYVRWHFTDGLFFLPANMFYVHCNCAKVRHGKSRHFTSHSNCHSCYYLGRREINLFSGYWCFLYVVFV